MDFFAKTKRLHKGMMAAMLIANPFVRSVMGLDLPSIKKHLESGRTLIPSSTNLWVILHAAAQGAIEQKGFSKPNADILCERVARILDQHGMLPIDEKAVMVGVLMDNPGIIQFLVKEKGVSPDGQADQPYSPLFKAVDRGSMACFRMLLDLGADPMKPSYNGYTLLMALASLNRKEMVELLFARISDPQQVELLTTERDVRGSMVLASQFAPEGEELSQMLEKMEIKAIFARRKMVTAADTNGAASLMT